MLAQLAVVHVVACIAYDNCSELSATNVMYGSDAVRLPMTTAFVLREVFVASMKRNQRPMVSPTASGMETCPGTSTIWLLPSSVALTAEIQEASYGFADGAVGRDAPLAYAVPLGIPLEGRMLVRLE
jgi:hypothetical protein